MPRASSRRRGTPRSAQPRASLRRAKDVLRIEAEAIRRLIPKLDAQFARAVEVIVGCKGRVVVTGMGKPGFIGQKFSATLSSTGTPSLALHPAEAVHGDLGRITKDDVIIALSNSGETPEITQLLPVIKQIGAHMIAMTGNARSTLARHSDLVIDVGVKREACTMNLAPTASTTAMLAMCDALAVVAAERRGFKERDFALFHPGGQLGRRLLLRVSDLMRTDRSHPVVREHTKVKDVLLAITNARAGSASVVDLKGRLVGIFTDGDLRRHFETTLNLPELPVRKVMTPRPKTLSADRLAAEAIRMLREYRIDELVVVDDAGRPVGLLDVQDLLKAGF